jgi:hypothetical protein
MKKTNWKTVSGMVLLLVIAYALSHSGATNVYDNMLQGLDDKNSNNYCSNLVIQTTPEGNITNIADMTLLGGIFVGALLVVASRDIEKED